MSRLHPQCPPSDAPNRWESADVNVREEPPDEEEEEDEDDGEDSDDDDDGDGYSE